tara:strand:+ start:1386 stop:2084 length:699 start_codon:yes stop_codon:yes gene_type:complete
MALKDTPTENSYIQKRSFILNGLCYQIANSIILDDINLNINHGNLIALIGPNGAGKSTLLKILHGAIVPTNGKIIKNGETAYMPQRSSIDWSFPIKVIQMVKLGCLGSRSNTKNDREVNKFINKVGLQGKENIRLSDLSGGQQQKVLLARTLIQKSKIILLDEPHSAIDPPSRNTSLEILRDQSKEGQTIIVSHHDWGESLERYDHVLLLNKTIKAFGSPFEIKKFLSNYPI